jgi:hypothetical protein
MKTENARGALLCAEIVLRELRATLGTCSALESMIVIPLIGDAALLQERIESLIFSAEQDGG